MSSKPLGSIRVLVVLLALAAALLPPLVRPATATATDGDIGYQDQSYAGAATTPTAAKPESKLWWNDGSWWASMVDLANSRYGIFRLDRSTQTWISTGVALDPRLNTQADTLWDGSHLYVASHVIASSSATAVPTFPSRLYRFSYSTSTHSYSLDAGFPANINNVKSETLTIDKDSTGKLWATWAQAGQVMVAGTSGSDMTWGTPFVLPTTGATSLDPDDISSVVAFGGNKIGVMWSNQGVSAMYFAVHADGQPDSTWEASRTALQGPGSSDDHINLKSLQADGSGRVFAAVKTSMDGVPNAQNQPLIMLLVRDAATGDWSSAPFGRVSDSHTRPIVMLDEQHNVIHMFASGPSTAGTVAYSGTIYEKTSPLNNVSFTLGLGTPVIRDAASADMNNATSTKQNVNSATGLVVMASNDTTSRYWHADESLGTTGAPSASFTATPTSGTAPLQVSFTDTSTGSPTSWSWSFGDGTSSTAQNPSHTYAAAGTYTVSLTATNAGGSDTATRTGYITVSAPSSTVTVTPSADTFINSGASTKNYGTLDTLKVAKSSSGTYRTYLQFNVTGLTGTVASVKLRLYVTDASPDGGAVHGVTNGWTETGITWDNAPANNATALGNVGAVSTGSYVEVGLPSTAVTGNGTYSFVVRNNNSDAAWYSSKEAAANPPQLVITQG
jgi:PKD repeat protein